MTITLDIKKGGEGDLVGQERLADFKKSMRRFAGLYRELPVKFKASCPKCAEVVESVFDKKGEQVFLEYNCPVCGTFREVHHDAIWSNPESEFSVSPRETFSGSRIRPNARRLPRTVESLCPQCSAIILARYFVQDSKVLIEKTCPEHGYFRDCISSDTLLYSKAAWWSFEEHSGQRFPQVKNGCSCPSDCGLCNQHLSSACLAQIDLTNRCNMKCPICFANAGTAGYIYEPDFEQIVTQLRRLRELRPTPCSAIQFSGGEPTIHPDFLKIVSTARDMGFSYIQIATNGITLVDEDFARKCKEAGLHTLYLQFDGIGEQAYKQTRNYPGIWEKKLRTIESCRKAGLKVCLVPTIVKKVNDDQVGKILKFAIENIDVVSGISYQPVSFTGRISTDELNTHRYTLADLAHDICDASGASPLRDMFPLSIVVPLSQMLEAVTGNPKIRSSSHTDCAFGTYFLVSPDGTPYPFPAVVNVEGMFFDMNRIAAKINKKGKASWFDKLEIYRMFKRHFNKDNAPPSLTVKKFVRSLQGLVDKKVGRGEGEKLTYKTLLCAGMHFQDRYNFDAERVKRCVILYSTPAGVFPFCTFNCGPEYRYIVESSYVEHGGERK